MTDKIYLAAAFLLGCCIFSFLNVVIYRLPKKMDFVTGRSACPFCGHVLGAPDMVPVLGWVFLGGKCRYCKAGISVRYPLVELVGGIAAVLCSYHYGVNPRAIIAFLFLCVLTVVSFVDMDTMEIPFSLVIAAALMGVLSALFFPEISFVERVIGIFCVSVPLYLLTVAVPGAFGGGDIKLTAACGVVLGFDRAFTGLFLALCLLAVWHRMRMEAGRIRGKKRENGKRQAYPLVPFLWIGMLVSVRSAGVM